jgi:MoaA/NifB/PqqE/SkfB family radical SAM enzyme
MKLHIELTNRCTLACPACPRTQWKNILKRPVEKADLDMHALEKFLDCEGGQKISKFVLCGDYGDSIYYPDLLAFLKKFRDTKSFNIITNGSRQNAKFWNQLTEILDERDTVIFSIDGLEDTNHIYRVNSDWSSIMVGLDIVAKSKINVHWKTIIFNHNYQDLDKIKQFAESKGVIFSAEKTHRFGNDSLMPPETFIETNHLFQEKYNSAQDDIIVEPQCEQEKTVTCNGYLFPCDWIRNPRTLYKSQLWKQHARWLEKLNIETTNYDLAVGVVKDWANFVRSSSIEKNGFVDVLCKMKCRESCQQNKFIDIT